MFKLVVTELAHQDLDCIISYIAIKLSNPKAARDFLDAVTACYGFLKSNPVMYELLNNNGDITPPCGAPLSLF